MTATIRPLRGQPKPQAAHPPAPRFIPVSVPLPAGADPLLRLPSVEVMTCQKKSWIYDQMRQRQFPLPVKLSGRGVAWRFSEVQAWIDARERVGAESKEAK